MRHGHYMTNDFGVTRSCEEDVSSYNLFAVSVIVEI